MSTKKATTQIVRETLAVAAPSAHEDAHRAILQALLASASITHEPVGMTELAAWGLVLGTAAMVNSRADLWHVVSVCSGDVASVAVAITDAVTAHIIQKSREPGGRLPPHDIAYVNIVEFLTVIPAVRAIYGEYAMGRIDRAQFVAKIGPLAAVEAHILMFLVEMNDAAAFDRISTAVIDTVASALVSQKRDPNPEESVRAVRIHLKEADDFPTRLLIRIVLASASRREACDKWRDAMGRIRIASGSAVIELRKEFTPEEINRLIPTGIPEAVPLQASAPTPAPQISDVRQAFEALQASTPRTPSFAVTLISPSPAPSAAAPRATQVVVAAAAAAPTTSTSGLSPSQDVAMQEVAGAAMAFSATTRPQDVPANVLKTMVSYAYYVSGAIVPDSKTIPESELEAVLDPQEVDVLSLMQSIELLVERTKAPLIAIGNIDTPVSVAVAIAECSVFRRLVLRTRSEAKGSDVLVPLMWTDPDFASPPATTSVRRSDKAIAEQASRRTWIASAAKAIYGESAQQYGMISWYAGVAGIAAGLDSAKVVAMEENTLAHRIARAFSETSNMGMRWIELDSRKRSTIGIATSSAVGFAKCMSTAFGALSEQDSEWAVVTGANSKFAELEKMRPRPAKEISALATAVAGLVDRFLSSGKLSKTSAACVEMAAKIYAVAFPCGNRLDDVRAARKDSAGVATYARALHGAITRGTERMLVGGMTEGDVARLWQALQFRVTKAAPLWSVCSVSGFDRATQDEIEALVFEHDRTFPPFPEESQAFVEWQHLAKKEVVKMGSVTKRPSKKRATGLAPQTPATPAAQAPTPAPALARLPADPRVAYLGITVAPDVSAMTDIADVSAMAAIEPFETPATLFGEQQQFTGFASGTTPAPMGFEIDQPDPFS